MKAKKENKVYTIDEREKKRYLEGGYDIYDDDGNVIEYSPKKLIKYSEYEKILKENEAMKAQLEVLQADSAKTGAEAKKKSGDA